MEPEHVDMNALVGEMTGMLRRLLGAGVRLSFEPQPDLKPVYGDPRQIEQILVNLCTNARDAVEGSGEIVIETRNVLVDRVFVTLHPWAREGAYVILTVTDDGSGIDADIRERIFEPFFTTKEPGSGTGLGLANVYALAKRHEGFVDLTSEPGHGSSFAVYLPAEESACSDPAAGQPAENDDDERPVVLLAQEDELMRSLAERMLRKAGYRTLTARDGKEAIVVFDRHPGPVDLAILDVLMPRLSGQATHDALRKRDPGLAVLFATDGSLDPREMNLIPGGATRAIRKPFLEQDLLREVEQALPS